LFAEEEAALKFMKINSKAAAIAGMDICDSMEWNSPAKRKSKQ
jgi:hypothetical protein